MPLTVGPGSIAVALTLGSNLHEETHLQLDRQRAGCRDWHSAHRVDNLPVLSVLRTNCNGCWARRVRAFSFACRRSSWSASESRSCSTVLDDFYHTWSPARSSARFRRMESVWRFLPGFLVVSAGSRLRHCCSHPPAGKRYELQGRVVAVDAAARQLTIAHEDIPGLMAGMTMPFTVSTRTAWVFKSIAPGDEIHATLVLGDHAELQDITFTRTSDAAQRRHFGDCAFPSRATRCPISHWSIRDGKTIHFTNFAASRCCSPSSIPAARFPTTARA